MWPPGEKKTLPFFALGFFFFPVSGFLFPRPPTKKALPQAPPPSGRLRPPFLLHPKTRGKNWGVSPPNFPFCPVFFSWGAPPPGFFFLGIIVLKFFFALRVRDDLSLFVFFFSPHFTPPYFWNPAKKKKGPPGGPGLGETKMGKKMAPPRTPPALARPPGNPWNHATVFPPEAALWPFFPWANGVDFLKVVVFFFFRKTKPPS